MVLAVAFQRVAQCEAALLHTNCRHLALKRGTVNCCRERIPSDRLIPLANQANDLLNRRLQPPADDSPMPMWGWGEVKPYMPD